MVLITKPNPNYFIAYIKRRIANNKNAMLICTGPTGSGKSMSMLRLGEIIDPDFKVHKLQFTIKGMMSLVNGDFGHLNKGSVIIMDELGVAAHARNFQSLANKMFHYVLQTWRHRGIVFLACVPSMDFVDVGARKLFHARLETIKIDYENKHVHIKPLLLQYSQSTGKLYNHYLKVRIPGKGKRKIKLMKVGMPSEQLIKEYELKKNHFTMELNQSIQKDLDKDRDKNAKIELRKQLTPIQEQVVSLLKEGLSIEQVSVHTGRAASTIKEHMWRAKKKGVQIRPVKEGSKVSYYQIA